MKEKLYKKIFKTLDLDNLKNYTILDLGCGQGHLLNIIKKTLNNKSKLIGIDSSDKSIMFAKENFKDIDFQLFKFIDKFNFQSNYFDLILSIDTLECIPNKNILIKELYRILKPCGKLLIAHWDWDTQVYNTQNEKIIRNIVHQFADWKQGWMDACDGLMGRKIWGLFQGSKYFNGHMTIFNLIETEYTENNYGYDRLKDIQGLVKKGVINQKDYEIILDEMNQLYSENKYFYSINSFIYYGEKINKEGSELAENSI